MITMDDYLASLKNKGNHLGEVRKNRSDMLMNVTFTGDPAYRKVYILDPDTGWKWSEAKFFKHQTPQLARDHVDSWLQFRPKEHHPVGCYVFIPDDTSYEMDIDLEHPFRGDISNLWMIVDKTDYRQFPQYMVLKINWDLKWLLGSGDRKRIEHCWSCVRSANSQCMARYVWKRHSVFPRIAGTPQS